MSKVFGIIGGSGVSISRESNWVAVKTPFGEPSDEILTGVIGDQKFAFLHVMVADIDCRRPGLTIGRIFGL